MRANEKVGNAGKIGWRLQLSVLLGILGLVGNDQLSLLLILVLLLDLSLRLRYDLLILVLELRTDLRD